MDVIVFMYITIFLLYAYTFSTAVQPEFDSKDFDSICFYDDFKKHREMIVAFKYYHLG